MKRLTRGLTGIIAGATIGLAAITGAAANSWITSEIAASDTVISGCVIRFSDPDGKPTIHANGAHQCAGVKSVSITPAGRMRVTQTITDPSRHPIIFAFVQTDETLSGRGIIGGASGGTGDTEFVFHDTTLGRQLDLTKRSDRMRMQGKNSNAWIGWVHAGGAS